MSFTVFENLIQLIVGLTGIVIISLILFSIKSNKFVNFYLLILIAFASARMISRSTFSFGIQSKFYDFSAPYTTILLSTIPLFYLYFKAIVLDDSKFHRKDLIHFIFPILLLGINLMFYDKQVIGISNLRLFNLLFCTFFTFIYTFKSLNILFRNIWTKTLNIHQEHSKLIKNWTKFLGTICVLLSLRFIASIIYEWLNGSELKGIYMIFIHVAFWLVVFLKILISPEILYGLPKLHKKSFSLENTEIIVSPFWDINGLHIANEQDKKLKEKVDTRILGLIEGIEFLAVNNNYFRNQKITIADMANELSVPTSHLVYIFKYHCNLSFTEYKTIIKIEDAKKLIETGFLKVNTLESLAIEVGFSSYNPFFTAFKKLVGKSPNEYSLSTLKL